MIMMERTARNPDAGDQTLAEDLRARGVKGVLVQMAERGQLMELRCEMPQCYCPKGRAHFDRRSNPMTDWAPNPDHYPVPKWAHGHLGPDNVRLAHAFCNRTDYGWRTSIKSMLAKGKSLEQIADTLNRRKVRRPHGQVTWTGDGVRKVFVS
jgi:hypothetical protein